MILKSSALTLLVSGLLSANAFAEINLQQFNANETEKAYAKPNSNSLTVYAILLKEKSVLDNSYAISGNDRNTILASVVKGQDELLSDILAIDPQAIFQKRLRIVQNMIYVAMSKETATKITHNPAIETIFATNEYVSNDNTLSAKPEGLTNLKVNDSNGAPVVAIIGAGVDYTHESLGGNGDYSTAYDNITNSWSGFPNKVVIGGFDFSSENGIYDYNPLEYAANYTDGGNVEYKSGYGTMAASLIRQAARDAKILAYKVSGISFNGLVMPPNRNAILDAIEMSMDPNLDGNMVDSADIIILDTPLSTFGFYKEHATGLDPFNVEVKMLRAIAAAGTLVVLPSGKNSEYQTYKFDENGDAIRDEEGEYKLFTEYYYSYFNISNRAVAPDALSVGVSLKENGIYKVHPGSAIGPTRGDSVLKPDVLIVEKDVSGAQAASGNLNHRLESNNFLLAAKAAATATSILLDNPQLTPSQVKALIVNTGIINVENDWGVPQIGGGNINPLAANGAPALMMDNDNQQPSLNFGFTDVFGKNSFSRDILVKNITDKEQVFTSELILNGENANNHALTVSFPSTVILAPNEQKIIPLTLTIDAEKLDFATISHAKDFTINNWDSVTIQGYLKLNNEHSVTQSIKIPWLIIPQPVGEISADLETADYVSYRTNQLNDALDRERQNLPHDDDIKDNFDYELAFGGTQIDVVNHSKQNIDLVAMPILFQRDRKPNSLLKSSGHILKTIAGGILPEQQCNSGEKLSMALQFFDPLDVPVSNHLDKIGNILFFIKLFNMQAVEHTDHDNARLGSLKNSQNQLLELKMMLGRDDKFKTHYIDFNMDSNPNNLTARLKPVELETNMSPNRDALIVNVCTDQLIHGNVTAESFNEDLAIFVGSDRETVPGPFDAPFIHNFKLGGLIQNEVKDVVDVAPEDVICENNQVKDANHNCIQIYNSDIDEIDLDTYFGFTESDAISTSCQLNEELTYECSLQHRRFVAPIEYIAAIAEHGNVVCSISAGTTLASCIPKTIKDDDLIRNERYIFDLDLSTVLSSAEIDLSDGITSYSGTIIKMAHKTSAEQDDFNWQSALTLAPNERARVSFLIDTKCDSWVLGSESFCLPGAILMNTEMGFFANTSVASLLPIQPEQRFSVKENAKNGDIIGKLKQVHRSLISRVSNGVDTSYMLIGAGDNEPFYLDSEHNVRVGDSSKLDYETQAHYTLTGQVKFYDNYGDTFNFAIDVINENDTPPQLIADLPKISVEQGQEIETIYMTDYFVDVDGVGLRFSADNLPQGIHLTKAGKLSGMPSEHGSITSKVTASDGQHAYQSTLEFDISKSATAIEKSSDSSSSGGAMFYSLLLLCLFVRRQYQ